MKATPVLTEPQLSATPWTDAAQPCPALVGYPTRESLPAKLKWSGRGELPAVGQSVHLHLNSIGPAVVRGYFHYEGFLGVLIAPEKMPAHLRGLTLCHAYGSELEPRRLRLNTSPTPAEVSTDWVPDYPESAAA